MVPSVIYAIFPAYLAPTDPHAILAIPTLFQRIQEGINTANAS
jgi:hypothetical protein